MKIIIKKYSTILLAVCVLLSTQSYAYAQTAITSAQVVFTAGEGPTYPVDPENPGTDITTEPTVAGSLAIVSVSNFDFGAIPVKTTDGLYDITTDKPNIQVVDLRGSGTGWKVSAGVSSFTSDGSDSLPGASILINNGNPNSLSVSPAPVQHSVELTTDGQAAPVITAAAGAGTGLWVMRWYPPAPTGEQEPEGAYVQLSIPAGTATVGNHSATINWTLANTP